jgi:hypothetical protein
MEIQIKHFEDSAEGKVCIGCWRHCVIVYYGYADPTDTSVIQTDSTNLPPDCPLQIPK